MNSIEDINNFQKIVKYAKYLIILLLLVGIFFLIKNCGNNYKKIEYKVIEATQEYINKNNIVVTNETYIELSKLDEIEGTELCKKSSGVLVQNKNGKLNYIPYLSCADYQNQNKNKSKFIKLNGDSIIYLNKDEIFNDPSYTMLQDCDVVINGNVQNTPGVYTIKYLVYSGNHLEETLERKVIVTSSDKDLTVSGLVDKNNPVLTLNGNKYITLSVGEEYVEPGYRAVDYVDGKISREVNVSPRTFSTANEGNYTIVYSVKNSRGAVAIASRNIKVVKQRSNLTYEISSTTELAATSTITLTVRGSGLNKVISPISGVKYTSDSEVTIVDVVNKNGTFTYNIYDTYGVVQKAEIVVTSIDDIPPTGSCSALVREKMSTEIEVTATDNKGIAGYSYVLNNKKTSFSEKNKYKENIAYDSISVIVKDVVGNEAQIACDVTRKEAAVVRGTGNSWDINASEYNLVATKNDVLKFASTVRSNNVSQSAPPGYPDYCLSFAYYHTYMLAYGDYLGSMTAEAASKYAYATRFQRFIDDDKNVVLNKIYEEIMSGRPLVLHVNGNKAGTSRHYVTVVGIKASVTSASELTEQDLLILDSNDGRLERMDASNSRFLISGWDTGRKGDKGYGYQIYIFK